MLINHRILVVDDEFSVQQSLGMILKERYELQMALTAGEGVRLFQENPADLVILDLRLPDKSGIEVLKEFKNLSPNTPIVMLTAVDDARTAVEAIKLGATDYLLKPFNVEEMRLIVDRALSEGVLRQKVVKLEEEVSRIHQFENIVGKSPAMQKVFRTLAQVMNQEATVLLLGESGTGKELAARALHYNSNRKLAPFIAIDCSSIPRDLLESELFGHEKGAFTGAHQRKKGTFEMANGGTLFLDEVGELPLDVQAKLLRAIQEREFRRIGGSDVVTVNVRIVAATNRDLKQMQEEGKFRKDLYYRLNVVPVELPPLRHRREDVPLLAHHFFRHLSERTATCVKSLSQDLMQTFLQYDWPGNVRELAHTMERLLITVEEPELRGEHFRRHFLEKDGFHEHLAARLVENFSLERATEEFEKKLIEDALKTTDGVVGKAADRLRTTRRILKYKIDKLGIAYVSE